MSGLSKFLWLPGVLLLLAFNACQPSPEAPTHPEQNNDSAEVTPPKPKLKPALMANGKYELLVPENFTLYVEKTVDNDNGEPVINTYKLVSNKDSVSAVGISHGIKDNANQAQLVTFMNRLNDEARGYKNLRSLDTYKVVVEGRTYGVMEYSLWLNGEESDFAVAAATVVGSNLLTVNMIFKGPRLPYYSDMAKEILESLKIKDE